MRYIRNLFVSALVVAMFSFVTVSAQNQTVSQNAIEQKVFKEINRLPYYGLFDHIAFKVDGGTVTLYGKTTSLGTRKSAERVVKRIPGVIEVVNNIDDVMPSSYDRQIRQQIVREFVNSPGIYPYIAGVSPQVRIIVDNGRVSLEGYVNSKTTANLMGILANRVPGTFRVTNNLIVDRNDG